MDTWMYWSDYENTCQRDRPLIDTRHVSDSRTTYSLNELFHVATRIFSEHKTLSKLEQNQFIISRLSFTYAQPRQKYRKGDVLARLC